ncbi:MAG: acyl carrier protein, partial [Succinivibrio sp.]
GINKVGLQRRGFSKEAISAIWQSYLLLYKKHLTIEDAIAEIEKIAAEVSEVKPLLDFLKNSGRGIIR